MKIIFSYVIISVEGLGIERFFNICVHNHIKFKSISHEGDKVIARMTIEDFKKIRRPARIAGVKVRIRKKYGIRFIAWRNRKRYFYPVGIVFFIIFSVFISQRLLRIEINGNKFYSDKEIYEYLKSSGIAYGGMVSSISCAEIELKLRENFPQITWVSVDTNGTKLTVNIKENEDSQNVIEELPACDISAAKDGIVESIVVRSGTPVVKPGDTVITGDVLVMSKVSFDNVTGENFGVEYVHADADITLSVINQYSNVINRKYEKKNYTGNEKTFSGIKIGNYSIIPGNEKCDYKLYDIETIYEPVQYDNLKLPITYFYTTYKEYTLTVLEYTDEELVNLAESALSKYIEKLEENSIQIISNSVKIQVYGESVTANGEIITYESAVINTEPYYEPLGGHAQE